MKCPKCRTDNPDTSRFCGSCAAALVDEAAPSLTKTLQTPAGPAASGALIAGKYRIVEEVGRGGMGIVYKAEDIRLQRPVALKFLPHQWVSDPDARERFVQEARAASALDHPNICNIYEIGEIEDGRMYIAMAFYEGESLMERIKRGPLPVEEAVGIALQAAAGMAKAHEKGIVHRDIKPANILITREGVAKVVDFGLAKLAGQVKLTREGTTVGTVAYMSPEQARGEAVDRHTDIWSLGIVLYEMLSGVLPFKGEYERMLIHSILEREPERLTKRRKDLPPGLENTVFRALNKKPATRYQTMDELLEDLARVREGISSSGAAVLNVRSLWQRLQRPLVAIPLVLGLIILAGAIYQLVNRRSQVNWARNELMPKIIQLAESNREDYIEAYNLATEAERYIPHDPKLIEIFSKIAVDISIKTEPSGARIYMKDYSVPTSEWKYIGSSPIEKVRLPIGFFRWKMEKEGYEPDLTASTTFDWDWNARNIFIPYNIVRVLQKLGAVPSGMVRVTGATIPGIGEVGDFFIDRDEVTNKQFKEFVTNGGYQKREYWKHAFIKDGKTLTWDETIKEFVDPTGRPGPSTWQGGDYLSGQDDFPVSGVSWYEAAAYAEFTRRTLPSVSHWAIARGDYTPFIRTKGFFTILAPLSNFKGEGPAPVGKYVGITPYGAYDMAGNVREWCWNETPGGRAIRGGAWNDTPYMFQNLSQAPPFDRSLKNGFRCALYIDPERIPGPLFSIPQEDWSQDLYKQKPVSDAIFAIYKEQFSYDKASLNARLEKRDESSEDWIQEKISFDAVYHDERVVAFLFLPKRAHPPFQTVIYFPGSFSAYQRSSEDLDRFYEFVNFVSFIIKNGRAVLYPVYKGTFERGNDELSEIHGGEVSRRYVELFIQIVKDFKRSIDYLETRPDIDINKLAYYGLSWGGLLGSVIPAVENRLKVSVLSVGGILSGLRPEADPINYVTRVKIPTLMLNGRNDLTFPFDMCVRPMFDLLGTPKDQKALKVYETDHFIPKNEVIKETLAWLDKYLGPVR